MTRFRVHNRLEERLLECGVGEMSSLQFNAVLLDMSNHLSSDELGKMKFLCGQKIGKRDLETVTSGLKLFQLLTERRELGADNTDFLSECLKHIQRHDLADKLELFPHHPGDPVTRVDPTEKAKLDIATGVIAENLGRTWRKLGRKLGLTDVKLESISKRHPTELEETVVELLKEWRRSKGAEARVEDLIKALRECQYNLTADKVEDKLEEQFLP